MHFWPILLPPLVFAFLWVTILGREGTDSQDGEAWRQALVKAAVVCGAFVTVSTEILGFFDALTPLGLILAWSLALLASAVVCWRVGAWARAWRWLAGRDWRISWIDGGLSAGLTVVVLLTGLTAWYSPPNTTDSLLYHMTRVMHWAQDASLRHYPTSYEVQLWFPTWAETAILTLRQLWGNDRLAGMVQWLAYAGSLIVVAGIAGRLGAGIRGRLLAAAFCAGIPMAALQASSTQNDLVVGFWVLCLAYLLLSGEDGPACTSDSPWIGAALGLGILSKGTAFMYLTPFAVWYMGRVWMRHGAGRAVVRGSVIVTLAAILNAGVWLRNWTTYASPVGPMSTGGSLVRLPPWMGWPVNWAAHLTVHFASHLEGVNASIEAGFARLADLLRFPIQQFHLTWSWNHEDLAGSPIHLAAIGLVLLAMLLRRRRSDALRMGGYAAAGVAAFGLVTTLVSWNPYVVRLHLPFLMTMAPLVGAWTASRLPPGRVALLSGLLLLLSLPWVLLNQTRPLIGLRPRTAIVSVLRAEPVDILFANWLPVRDDFIAASQAVKATGCTQIGLRIDSHDLEYPLWWLLGAPQNGLRMEHLDPVPHLARYADPSFKPCAVLCTICGGRELEHGLERQAVFGRIAVYAGGEYSPDREP